MTDKNTPATPLVWTGQWLTPCPCGAMYGPPHDYAGAHRTLLSKVRARLRAWFICRALDLGWKP